MLEEIAHSYRLLDGKVQVLLVERGLIGMDGALAVGVSEPGARQAGPYDSGGLFTWGRR